MIKTVTERAPRLYSFIEPLNADIIGYQELIETLSDGKFPSDHYGLKTVLDCPL